MVAKNMSLLVSFTFIAVFLLLPGVDSQICTKRSVFTKYHTEWYEFTYTETYRGNCWYKCIKTRVRIQRQPREVVKRVVQDKNVCCDGYTRVDDGIDDDRISCQAICIPPCINGNCTSPGQCVCHEGYVKNSTECLPVCPNSCQHGKCVAPNTCQCQAGYELVNPSTCQPVCTESCANGTCVGPDICQCLVGYRKSESNTCEPYCFFGCEHGSCIAPETCRCDPGWYLTEENKCAPTCDQSCGNGTCAAPNRCGNGTCTAPNRCGNGTCTAPNRCECLPGYTLNRNTSNEHEELCVPFCRNCEGRCVAPNRCICELPYQAKHTTVEGEDCDCFENCANASRKCDRTICTIFVTSVATTELQTIVDDEATENTEVYKINNTLSISTLVNTGENETTANVSLYIDATVSYNHTSDKLEDDETWLTYTWIYIVLLGAVLVSVLMIVVLIYKWKYVMIYFKGSSYVVEDSKDDSVSAQFANIQFSSIANNDESKQYEDKSD